MQAVAAEPDIAQALDVTVGSPLLLLEGITQDVHGRGLDWFHVWHRANTVFDVDPRVPASTPVPHERIVQLRQLVRDLESALAELEAGNT